MKRDHRLVFFALAVGALLELSSGPFLAGQEDLIEVCDDGEDNDQDGDV